MQVQYIQDDTRWCVHFDVDYLRVKNECTFELTWALKLYVWRALHWCFVHKHMHKHVCAYIVYGTQLTEGKANRSHDPPTTTCENFYQWPPMPFMVLYGAILPFACFLTNLAKDFPSISMKLPPPTKMLIWAVVTYPLPQLKHEETPKTPRGVH